MVSVKKWKLLIKTLLYHQKNLFLQLVQLRWILEVAEEPFFVVQKIYSDIKLHWS